MKVCLINLGALAMAVLGLAGCGGGGSESAAAAQACTPQHVTIALGGDSTQWGYDGETGLQSTFSPTALMQAAMDARFGAGAVTVLDLAVPGTTSAQAVHSNAQITVANFGINDMLHQVPLDQYRANLAAIGATVYETPSPVNAYFAAPGYPEAMRAVATQRGAAVADVDAYVRSLPNWRLYLADGIHPNAMLYQLISANVLVPAITAQVEMRRCSQP